MIRRLRHLALGLSSIAVMALLLMSPAPGAAQETGSIAGVVTEQGTSRSLSGAQVDVPGLEVGTLTGSGGSYELSQVPVGTHSVRVTMLGYRAGTAEAVVVAGETTRLDFALQQQAIGLDQIVVTGTVGGAQRRSLGTVLGTVDVADQIEVSPAQNVQELLGGRIADVVVMPGSGNVGTGSATRIRGVSSLTLSNEPLIYIDGVRVNNSTTGGPSIRQGRQVNRLNDINPEDIESIEVIKGPAASTLYGTEASNGVIQIITKKGSAGSPTYNLSISQGATWLMDPSNRVPTVWGPDPDTGELMGVNLYEREANLGQAPFRTGHNQSYDLSIRGGTDQMRYFASVGWGQDNGIVDYNWKNQLSGRSNLSLIPNESWSVDFSLGYMQSETRFAQAAAGWGIWDQLVWGSPQRLNTRTRGMLRATPEVAGEIDSRSDVLRFTGGVNVAHSLTQWFRHRLTLGLDNTEDQSQILFPMNPAGSNYFFGSLSLGDKTAERRRQSFFTVDYSATVEWEANERLLLETSGGFQYYIKQFEDVAASGRFFPAPSVTEIAGAAQTFSSEESLENRTVGVFIQEQVSFDNRLFLTAAVRGDDNSAFGDTFDFVVYPKVSGSWVLSEEGFWSWAWVDQLRLRGAWGQSGQQPDVFAAVRLYEPATGPGDRSVISPSTFGNPDLKPEVGSELEFGFDASFLDERMSVEFTYFDRTTKDAIVQAPVAPSSGFPGSQFINLGEIRSWGASVGLRSRLLDTPNFTWALSTHLATNDNEVVSTGDLGDVILNARQRHREGYPVGAFFIQKVVSADLGPDGTAVNILCAGGAENNHQPVSCEQAPRVYLGTPTPTWEGSVSTDLTFFGDLRLFALVDFRGGHGVTNGDIEASHHTFRNSRAIHEETHPLLLAADQTGFRETSGLYDAGFAKLREVSITYTIPTTIVDRVGASRAQLNVGVRNLARLWRAQEDVFGHPIPDPEVRTPSANLSAYVQTVIPPTSTFTTSLRVTF